MKRVIGLSTTYSWREQCFSLRLGCRLKLYTQIDPQIRKGLTWVGEKTCRIIFRPEDCRKSRANKCSYFQYNQMYRFFLFSRRLFMAKGIFPTLRSARVPCVFRSEFLCSVVIFKVLIHLVLSFMIDQGRDSVLSFFMWIIILSHSLY